MSNVTFKIGDKIRSYDFEPLLGRGDCYLEGVVTEVEESAGLLRFDVTKEVWAGTEIPDSDKVGDWMQTTLPGRMHFGEWDGRVTVID